MSKRRISRELKVSRKVVKSTIKTEGVLLKRVRKDSITLDQEMVVEIYHRCDGWMERVHEIITEEKNIKIGYSTLTRKIREMGLRTPIKTRCDSVPDVPQWHSLNKTQ